MNNAAVNPFDLNPARAYGALGAFCPRPDLDDLLARSVAGHSGFASIVYPLG